MKFARNLLVAMSLASVSAVALAAAGTCTDSTGAPVAGVTSKKACKAKAKTNKWAPAAKGTTTPAAAVEAPKAEPKAEAPKAEAPKTEAAPAGDAK